MVENSPQRGIYILVYKSRKDHNNLPNLQDKPRDREKRDTILIPNNLSRLHTRIYPNNLILFNTLHALWAARSAHRGRRPSARPGPSVPWLFLKKWSVLWFFLAGTAGVAPCTPEPRTYTGGIACEVVHSRSSACFWIAKGAGVLLLGLPFSAGQDRVACSLTRVVSWDRSTANQFDAAQDSASEFLEHACCARDMGFTRIPFLGQFIYDEQSIWGIYFQKTNYVGFLGLLCGWVVLQQDTKNIRVCTFWQKTLKLLKTLYLQTLIFVKTMNMRTTFF